MTNGYRKQMKRFGEHTDIYLYGEESEDPLWIGFDD